MTRQPSSSSLYWAWFLSFFLGLCLFASHPSHAKQPTSRPNKQQATFPSCPHFDTILCKQWNQCWKKQNNACEQLRQTYKTTPSFLAATRHLFHRLQTRCLKRDTRACQWLLERWERGITSAPSKKQQIITAANLCRSMKSYCVVARKLIKQLLFTKSQPAQRETVKKELCKEGVGYACYLHAKSLVQNKDAMNKTYKQARQFFRKACKHHFAPSCYTLGIVYMEGLHVPSNRQKALQLFLQSCQKGYGLSCYTLGKEFALGLHVKPNPLIAGYFLKRSCKQGIKEGCTHLPYVQLLALPTPKETPKGFFSANILRQWRWNCQKKDLLACLALAHVASSKRKPNQASTRTNYHALCQQKMLRACTFEQLVKWKQQKENALLKKLTLLCKQNDALACWWVGKWFTFSQEMENSFWFSFDSRETPNKWFKRACLQGLGYACWELSRRLTTNPTKSLLYLSLACQKGIGTACRKQKKFKRGCQLWDKPSCQKRNPTHKATNKKPKRAKTANPLEQPCSILLSPIETCYARLKQQEKRDPMHQNLRLKRLYQKMCLRRQHLPSCLRWTVYAVHTETSHKNYQRLRRRLTNACLIGGNRKACIALIPFVRYGWGGRKSQVLVRQYQTKACQGSNHQKCLASLQKRPQKSTDQDKLEALCKQRDGEACFLLGSIHPPPKYRNNQYRMLGYYYFLQGCNANHPRSCAKVAERQRDVWRSNRYTIKYYRRSKYTRYKQYYKHAQKFRKKMLHVMNKACTLGQLQQCLFLSQNYKMGLNWYQLVKASPKKYLFYKKRACELGHKASCPKKP